MYSVIGYINIAQNCLNGLLARQTVMHSKKAYLRSLVFLFMWFSLSLESQNGRWQSYSPQHRLTEVLRLFLYHTLQSVGSILRVVSTCLHHQKWKADSELSIAKFCACGLSLLCSSFRLRAVGFQGRSRINKFWAGGGGHLTNLSVQYLMSLAGLFILEMKAGAVHVPADII